MTFTSAKLKKTSEVVNKKRIELYLRFNQRFLTMMPYLILGGKTNPGSLSSLLEQVKDMILFSMKNKFIKSSIEKLE